MVMYNVEDCTPHSWSDWNWSNIRQSCGNGIRNRSADTAKLGGRTCEELFGISFTTEMKIAPCPGIINNEICEINCHKYWTQLEDFSQRYYTYRHLCVQNCISFCVRDKRVCRALHYQNKRHKWRC